MVGPPLQCCQFREDEAGAEDKLPVRYQSTHQATRRKWAISPRWETVCEKCEQWTSAKGITTIEMNRLSSIPIHNPSTCLNNPMSSRWWYKPSQLYLTIWPFREAVKPSKPTQFGYEVQTTHSTSSLLLPARERGTYRLSPTVMLNIAGFCDWCRRTYDQLDWKS